MSGHKRETVTISQEEYRRMYEAERHAMYDTFTAPQLPSEERILQREHEFTSIFNAAEQRNQEYEHLIRNLQSELREVERHTQNQIKEKQTRLLEEMEQRTARVESDAQRWVNQRTQQLENEFAQYRQSMEQQVQHNQHFLGQQFQESLDKGLRQIRESNAEYFTRTDHRLRAVEQRLQRDGLRIQQIAESAQQWLNDGITMYDYLVSAFPQRSLENQELSELGQSLNQARNDMQTGFYESCLSTCRYVSSRLSMLRIRAENTEASVHHLMQQTLNSLDDLRQKANLCRHIQAIDVQGQPLDMALDVAEWAPQDYIEVANSIEAIEEQVRLNADHLNPEQLESILSNELPQLQSRILEMVDHVQHLSLNAQIRYNIAQMVVAAVVTQGYRVMQGSFEQEDFDKGYVLNARSADGGELIVRIDPIPGQVNAHDLHIISQDQQLRTESELRQRAREINKSLKQFNLEISNKQVLQRPSQARVTRKTSPAQVEERVR